MGFGSPFRAPCAGWPILRRLRSCFGHKKLSESHLQRWQNTTHVPDFQCGDDIFPFPRQRGTGLPGDCFDDPINANCDYDYPPDCGGTPSGKAPCNPWEVPGNTPSEFRNDCGTDATHKTIDGNCYLKVDEFLDQSTCYKFGFKNVQARKAWHGALPYNSPVRGDSPEWDSDHQCECISGRGPEQMSPPTTKYLTETLHAEITREHVDDPAIVDAQYICDATCTVGQHTGKKTHTCSDCAIVGGEEAPPSELPVGFTSIIGNVRGFNLRNIVTQLYCDWVSVVVGISDVVITPTADGIDWELLGDGSIGSGDTVGSMTVSGGDFHYEQTKTVVAGDMSVHEVESHEIDLSIADTTLTYHELLKDFTSDDTPPVYEARHYTVDITYTLSDEYTTADVYSELVGLLDQWDLTDDLLYPWRVDPFPSVAPLVTYDENQTPQEPTAGCPIDDEGTCPEDTSTFTGNIRGAPSCVGCDNHFDWQHVTWQECEGSPFDFTYGARSGQENYGDVTDYYPPKASTQWTDNLTACSMLPGAFLMSIGSVAYAQKWAETVIQRPSYNFFRPCGADRDLRDQSTINCDEEDEAFNPLGDLRFPDAWPICGRVPVLSASAAAGTVTVNLGQPAPYLRTGDHVDFTDGSGSVTESNKTVTVISETQFTFSGSVPTGTWVKSQSAPDYKWNDSDPKGDYVWAEWTWDNRDWQERDAVIDNSGGDCGLTPGGGPIRQYQDDHGMPRGVSAFSYGQGCAELQPCVPIVLCFSPNGEDFPSSPDTRTFPGSMAIDPQYNGPSWQGAFAQNLTDPLFQALVPPCIQDEETDEWTQSSCLRAADEGWCQPDDCLEGVGGTVYYAHPDLVENITALPSGAPSLPSGIYLGYLSLASLDTASPVSGNILPPPPAPGDNGSAIPNQATQAPWVVFYNERLCVCAAGRFSGTYQANGVSCR